MSYGCGTGSTTMMTLSEPTEVRGGAGNLRPLEMSSSLRALYSFTVSSYPFFFPRPTALLYISSRLSSASPLFSIPPPTLPSVLLSVSLMSFLSHIFLFGMNPLGPKFAYYISHYFPLSPIRALKTTVSQSLCTRKQPL